MKHPFSFDAEKAIEAVVYIAGRCQNPGFHSISKVMYFADRAHLQRYGRFITGDRYVAMKHGPVPSATYDILKIVRDDEGHLPFDKAVFDRARGAFQVHSSRIVVPKRDPALDLLSRSDRECLDASIKKYGNMSFQDLTDASHDEAWKATGENDIMEIEQIAATLVNGGEIVEYLNDRHP